MGTPQVPDGIAASSDVPYHLGIATDRQFGDRTLRLTMPSNPSHVELVSAVTLGKARAKQDLLRADGEADPEGRVLPLLLHRSEEHTSELQSLMRISYAVFCLKKKKKHIE